MSVWRRKELAADLAVFIRAYGRKAPHRGEPNDRGYDRHLEFRLKRMRPEELDSLLHHDVEEDMPNDLKRRIRPSKSE